MSYSVGKWVRIDSPLLVTLGAVPEAGPLVSEADVASLGPESFLLRARQNVSGQLLVACAGKTRRAIGYAFYEFLQQLGFGFLHPLKPVIPEALRPWQPLDVHETPRWGFRGTHYHTQHPLELTNFLNGYDASGHTDLRERWREAWRAWEDYLEWMLAQKQNYLEWMLLADRAEDKASFEVSEERRVRLGLIVDAAHALGLEVGIDVPLTLKQQHALNLLPKPSRKPAENTAQVKERVQWLLSCGFDHLGTELGSTEFTRGLDARELTRLLNETQEALGSRKLLVKNHCSTKQHADGFQDPRPDKKGAPLNFNYLNYFADARIVSMPHTVQAYSLTDPAPTYGNANFSDLRDWTGFLLQRGRPVVFYPETAYWVNYDISVPLFLAPKYATDRLEDAETLDAMPAAAPLLGQLNFESGWQWGYWLANSVQALVAWRRPKGLAGAFSQIFRFLPTATRTALTDLLVDFAAAQRRLLVEGRRADGSQTTPAPGTGPGSATAIAYLQGSEGLSDLASLAARYLGEGAPQPDRLHFMELWRETPPLSLRLARALGEGGAAMTDFFLSGETLRQSRRVWFQEQLWPLLRESNATFAALAARFAAIAQQSPSHGEVVQDLADSAQLLALRCSQVLALYEYVALCSPGECNSRLAAGRAAVRAAQALVSARAGHMGLEVLGDDAKHMVLEWSRPVPTAYSYGYLWAAQTLFYWRRDQEIVESEIVDPCFGTINDPVELGLSGGGGPWARWAQSAAQTLLSNRIWHAELSSCLGPREEPKPGLDHYEPEEGEEGEEPVVVL
ncbi:unnamed protein product [Symbiodinium pilosum]|uniref:Uncharacterized protein n=1 Tax=Symbiodinium pilosum TaxID=2952 RepID=A0A812SQ95_SYMPI|nr:unnamed protein product [Symbiodinium pilosum]